MKRMEEQSAAKAASALGVRNLGEPLRFKDVQPMGGFAIDAAKAGQPVEIWTRHALDSDTPIFHRLVENLDAAIRYMAEKGGAVVNLRRANTVLLVMRPDNTAELWIDAAAVAMKCTVKRSVAAQSLIFDNDIADVVAMCFPCVSLGSKDKVVCLFREGWSFGLAFDFNPGGNLDVDGFSTALGTLYRRLRFRHLYRAMNDSAIFERLLSAGWFPFVEIISGEFRELVTYAESGSDIGEVEPKIIESFDAARLGHLFDRWIARPHFAAKALLLKEAIDAFAAQKPTSAIKIILTEIEGILCEAHKAVHGGQGAKLKGLLAFAKASAEQRAGGPNTLFLPAAFGSYLANHTYASFDPVAQNGTAGSRHAVGHGAAAQDTYTMTRALQAILTLDQLAFYT